MSRLASLTTPSRTRSSPSPSPSPSRAPASPLQPTETTHHRMLKLVLAETRKVLGTWDDLVRLDGLNAGKSCIDEATELDNIVQLKEGPERPLVAPHLEKLTMARANLKGVLAKLDKLVAKLAALIEQAEKVFFEACRTQAWDFVLSDPLWLSWTLENFVDSLAPLLSLHAAHLAELTTLANIILSPSTSFDNAQSALERWNDLSRGGERWDAAREWEEIVALELGAGGVVVGSASVSANEEELSASTRRRGGKK